MSPKFRKFRSLYYRPESYNVFMAKFCLKVLLDGCLEVRYMNEILLDIAHAKNYMFLLCSTTSSKLIFLFYFGTIPYAMRYHKPIFFDPHKILCFTDLFGLLIHAFSLPSRK